MFRRANRSLLWRRRITKVFVVAVHRPGTRRNLFEFDEAPIARVSATQSQVVPNGRRNVESGAKIQVRTRALIAKDVLPVIRAERAAIFPLGIADTSVVPNGDPTAF